jgi:mannosyltransferase OCH1-like enzyme
LSDVVRVLLLKLYGGLWVDATTFCNKRLDDWLSNYIYEGFFAFNKPRPNRLISSWFIYSEKNNYITHQWFNKIVEYFKINNKPHTYFWVHHLFGDLYDADATFKEIWDKVPKLSANGLGPHYLQEIGMFKDIKNKNKSDINNKITPLYKLTYKRDFPEYDETLNVYYLYSTIK